MKKAWLIFKKVWWILLIALVGILYILLSGPRPPQAPPVYNPDKPEPEEAPDLLTKLIKKKEKVDEEIKGMGKRELIDNINNDYS